MQLFGESGVLNLTELKDGTIIACSFAAIKQILIKHDNIKNTYSYEVVNYSIICSTYISKCLELFNDELLCLTQQNIIIFLEKNKNNPISEYKDRNYITKKILELLKYELCINILQLSEDLFISCNINNSKYFDSIDSGSTVILVHINSKKIISINCGDSRAILITKRNNSNYLNRRNNNIIELSRDHKPDIPEEKMRIERSGGRVDKIYGLGPFRVWFKNEDFPGLAMSRSIGDRLAHRVGVSDIPEIKEFNIDENTPLAVVLASDGVWEFMSNEEVSEIVYRFEDNKDASVCAKKIVERARQVWEKTGYAIDDITCVVVFFKEI